MNRWRHGGLWLPQIHRHNNEGIVLANVEHHAEASTLLWRHNQRKYLEAIAQFNLIGYSFEHCLAVARKSFVLYECIIGVRYLVNVRLCAFRLRAEPARWMHETIIIFFFLYFSARPHCLFIIHSAGSHEYLVHPFLQLLIVRCVFGLIAGR